VQNSKKYYFQDIIESRRFSKVSLPDSFKQAQSIANFSEQSKNSDLEKLLHSAELMVNFVENDGKNKENLGTEPAYHNRQHLADSVLAMGCYLQNLYIFSDTQKLLLLLTMLCHDFGHVGASYKDLLGFNQEEKTVQLLKSTPLNQLCPEDFELISQLIRGTEKSRLSINRSNYAKYPENLFFLMQSLVNDADIAASFVESLGLKLSRLILLESGNANPTDQEIHSSIKRFKREYALTSTVARSFFNLI
jgi:hypothetical protein